MHCGIEKEGKKMPYEIYIAAFSIPQCINSVIVCYLELTLLFLVEKTYFHDFEQNCAHVNVHRSILFYFIFLLKSEVALDKR